uniref:UBX domain-containing protein n=1 Tax=Globodera pallida TaxID=36090 RepID=A0A183BVQ9_GLOPA
MSNIHGLNNDEEKPRRRQNSSDSENSDEGRQGFFVGGSERSGQEVLGPNRNNVSDKFFDAIQQAGAEKLTHEQNEALNSQGQNSGGGSAGSAAFRLGGHGVQSEQVGGTSTTADSTRQQAPVVVRLVLWTNGFSVNDGPLRQFQDPQNREFLQAVMTKRIPPELIMPGREIDLRIEKKSTEYEPPKIKPFSGKGNQLGSVAPNVENSSDVVYVDAPPKLSAEESAKLVEQAQAELKVDDNLPTTRIQIRIPDTARPIVARLNQTQTVDQLRIFIVSAEPSLAYRPFRLMTSYPTQPIEAEELSVKDAGLLNATVLVKFE